MTIRSHDFIAAQVLLALLAPITSVSGRAAVDASAQDSGCCTVQGAGRFRAGTAFRASLQGGKMAAAGRQAANARGPTHPGIELELVGRVAHVGLNEVILLDLPHPPERPPQSTLFRSAACNGPVAQLGSRCANSTGRAVCAGSRPRSRSDSGNSRGVRGRNIHRP